MLACLVAIPVAAVFGTSLPKVLNRLLKARWPVGSASVWEALSGSSRWGPTPPAATPGPWQGDPFQAASVGPMARGEPADPHRDWDVAVDRAAAGKQLYPGQSSRMSAAAAAATAQGGEILANYDSWADGAGAAAPPSAAVGPAGSQSGGVQLVPVRRANRQNGPPSAAAGRLPAQPPLQPVTTDRFTEIQRRLRQLGATYYLLESWQSQRRMYRFYCRISVGGNQNYTRYFEATDYDALQAMGKVLEQVEAWRTAP